MTDRRPLSDVDLLVWAVVLGYREQQERTGITVLLQPFPPCPTCKAAVHESTVSWVREIGIQEEVTITPRPCEHSHWASLSDLKRINDHLSAMFYNLEQQTMTTDKIVQEARARLGQLAGTEETRQSQSANSIRDDLLHAIDFDIDQSTIAPAATMHEPTVTWDEAREHMIRFETERARRALAVVEAISRAMQPIAEAVRKAAEAFAQPAQQAPTGRRRDRPAWQSPYGPARRR
ncbi:hypothetical protein [Streptomyces sp. SID8499]|uniref:hypothetical protein n=1 Tax=Streptomyces sp. SID8499 TaxID=2706106 RepID=UPI0013CD4632|nr:hypothetical protein [Streptomyces sp. SID8499]NED31052.1 hypothetical protein [Streptomyces sp. SID8499]